MYLAPISIRILHAIMFRIVSIGQLVVSAMLHETNHAINIALRHKISWASGQRIVQNLKRYGVCGLSAVAGA